MALLRKPQEPGPTELRDLADEDLMQLVRRGEASAFEVVYERHSSAAFSLAYRMCGTRSAAEDVVQEAFLSLWRSGARYDRARGSVRTWVLGIVHNRAIDSLRRSVVHDRRRASDEGIEERFEAKDRTDVEVARLDEAQEIRQRAEDAAGRAEPRDRARVLRRFHADGNRFHARHADRYGQGQDAPRTGEDASPARRAARGHAMTTCPRIDDAAAYVLRALPEGEWESYAYHVTECEACTDKVAELGFVSHALLSARAAAQRAAGDPRPRDVRRAGGVRAAAGDRRRP